MKQKIENITEKLKAFCDEIKKSENVVNDVPRFRGIVNTLKTFLDEEEKSIDSLVNESEADKERLRNELNRTSRNIWAMDMLYFSKLLDKKLEDLALTNDELKLRLCGWLDNLIWRFSFKEEKAEQNTI